MADALWNYADLARYLGCREATVRTLSSREPDRLPPRVPGFGLPRWHPATVEAWAQRPPAPRTKMGRPRKAK